MRVETPETTYEKKELVPQMIGESYLLSTEKSGLLGARGGEEVSAV